MKRLIIFDFDGTIRQDIWNYREKLKILSELKEKGVVDEIKKEKYMRDEFIKNCNICQDTQELIKKLSENYTLVIFSMASNKYVKENLNKYNLLKYFKSFYSAKDDFNSEIKEKEHFQKIFDDFLCKPKEVLHIADNYGIDYISSELGCETILVDHCPIKKYSIKEIKEKIGNN